MCVIYRQACEKTVLFKKLVASLVFLVETWFTKPVLISDRNKIDVPVKYKPFIANLEIYKGY